MGRFLRRSAVLGACMVALVVASGERAHAAREDKGQHGAKIDDGGAKQPPGLAGNVHAQAKGQAKKVPEVPVESEPSGPAEPAGAPKSSAASGKQAGGKSSAAGQNRMKGGSSEATHHHVIVCHRTGSASNPYVVLNIPWTAWSGAHDSGSSHAHPPLNGRVDVLLKDPASRPGPKDGFTAGDCRANDPATPTPPSAPPSPPAPQGGAPGGGPLGEDPGSSGEGSLPFTGFPALLALIAALGAAIGAAGVARGTSQQGESLERRTSQAADGADVRHVSAEETLHGTPHDPGAG
jgi:hypothetical protein